MQLEKNEHFNEFLKKYKDEPENIFKIFCKLPQEYIMNLTDKSYCKILSQYGKLNFKLHRDLIRLDEVI